MRRRNRNTTIIVFSIAIILIGAYFIGLLRPFRSLSDQLINPINRFVRNGGGGVVDGITYLGRINSLNRTNQQLVNEVDQLKKQLASVTEVARENELLREQLNAPSSEQYNLIPARVLGSSNDTVRTVFLVDKGSSAGIKEGMAVIFGSGLVGIVDKVDSFSAKILAVNDPVFKISAITQNSRATGIVSGQLGTGLKMEKISQNEPIAERETVVTAGSGLVPKGIIIGEIESIQRADNAIFQAANIKPAVNVSKLELVFVISGAK